MSTLWEVTRTIEELIPKGWNSSGDIVGTVLLKDALIRSDRTPVIVRNNEFHFLPTDKFEQVDVFRISESGVVEGSGQFEGRRYRLRWIDGRLSEIGPGTWRVTGPDRREWGNHLMPDGWVVAWFEGEIAHPISPYGARFGGVDRNGAVLIVNESGNSWIWRDGNVTTLAAPDEYCICRGMHLNSEGQVIGWACPEYREDDESEETSVKHLIWQDGSILSNLLESRADPLIGDGPNWIHKLGWAVFTVHEDDEWPIPWIWDGLRSRPFSDLADGEGRWNPVAMDGNHNFLCRTELGAQVLSPTATPKNDIGVAALSLPGGSRMKHHHIERMVDPRWDPPAIY